MNVSNKAAVSTVVCSEVNWMIEAGRRCKTAAEVHLIGLKPDVGGGAFLTRLAANERLEIIETTEGIVLRRA